MPPRLRPRTMLLAAILFATPASAADSIALLPAKARLDGPRSSQRFLVERRAGDAWTADLSAGAVFRVENPAVARVEPDGTVRPVANGTTALLARVEGRHARTQLVVARFDDESPWSFKNHVEPVL